MVKPAETDPIVRTTIRLPQSLLKGAKLCGIENGQSLQDIITCALEDYVLRHLKTVSAELTLSIEALRAKQKGGRK